MSTVDLGHADSVDQQPPATVDLRRARSVRIRGNDWPIGLPSVTDARLQTAGVVLTVHLLGQVALNFAVSVPQILAAILGAAVVEFIMTAVRQRILMWPASAMLTGSGVGLIFRVDGTMPSEHWSLHRWWWFSLVAIGSLLTKYLVRWRGSHVFNPSNIGLVVAFMLLGPARAEPLPFRWQGSGLALAAAYTVIVVGGLVITGRLGLLRMALVFWTTVTAGLGLVARSGHCMSAPWQLLPVCGATFWRSVAFSPEVCVFMFFMLTDPRTVPRDARSKVGFATAVAAVATLLIAPQRTEFGAKVALLGSLTIVCALRPVVDLLHGRCTHLTRSMLGRQSPDVRGLIAGVGAIGAVTVFAAAAVAAGAHARDPAVALPIEALPPLPSIDWERPSLIPEVTIGEGALELDPTMIDASARGELLRAVLVDLATEAILMRRGDSVSLAAVDHGVRLIELRSILDFRRGAGVDGWPDYVIESAELVAHRAVGQGSPLLALEVAGTESGSGRWQPWTARIAVRRAENGRWLIVEVSERRSN